MADDRPILQRETPPQTEQAAAEQHNGHADGAADAKVISASDVILVEGDGSDGPAEVVKVTHTVHEKHDSTSAGDKNSQEEAAGVKTSDEKDTGKATGVAAADDKGSDDKATTDTVDHASVVKNTSDKTTDAATSDKKSSTSKTTDKTGKSDENDYAISISSDDESVPKKTKDATTQTAPSGKNVANQAKDEQSAKDRKSNFLDAVNIIGPKIANEPEHITAEDAELLHSREKRAFGEVAKDGITAHAQALASENEKQT